MENLASFLEVACHVDGVLPSADQARSSNGMAGVVASKG